MAQYEMQEMNLPNEEGKRILYPRLILTGQKDTNFLAKLLARGTTFNAGEVSGLLQGLADEMALLLGQGYSIKLNGIGTFTPSLALRKDKEREEAGEDATRRNARSIEIGGIKFRPEKEFVRSTNRGCTLERSQQKFRRSSKKYTPQQRLKRALQYLDKYPYMTIADYAALTGLCHTTASLELKSWRQQPDSEITVSGCGTHRVYIRRAKREEETGNSQATSQE
ncbi:HU family DNA-binding protein [Parabacteroides pacaensis]|uniref:HU family DNA-binding protein n=1 Tax=Parabacteroides pacaensis TaxID=2086575 RepID=UPI000D0FC651|nr:HU family DNA-binding protein [Parabacteroides pacaensis]